MRKHTLVLLCLAVVLVFASAVMAGVNLGTGIQYTSMTSV